MSNDRDEIELIGLSSSQTATKNADSAVSKRGDRRALAGLAVLIIGIVGVLALPGEDPAVEPDSAEPIPNAESDDSDPVTEQPSDRLTAVQIAQGVPEPLLAAELFAAAPSADGLRDLLDAVGGFDGLQMATAEGAFDLVRFNPKDTNVLLASQRLSYGDAENQLVNEIWQVTPEGEVNQAPWDPSVSHDFVHFNVDGTSTMWVHSGGSGFAPRIAVALDEAFRPSGTTEPIYASRFTSANGTVFALTGNGDYYTNDTTYVDLVADDGSGWQTIDDGAQYAWIDNPTPDLLVAYPASSDGTARVWSTETLAPLPTHPLAGRPYRRVAVNADETIAVGATLDGELQVINLGTGNVEDAFGNVEDAFGNAEDAFGNAEDTFGNVDIAGVDQPITLNADGTIAITVERTGRVSMWWVGEDTPIASVEAHEGQPRWVSAEYASRTTSVVSADASRIAFLIQARADMPTSWKIVDTDPGSWIERACERAGRSLTDREVEALGLTDQPRACLD